MGDALDVLRHRIAAKKSTSGGLGLNRLFQPPVGGGAPLAPALPSVAEAYAPPAVDYTALVAALGGGPDKASYVRPFDEAASRANEAYAAAQPTITDAYAHLQERLRGNQSEFGATQARLAAEQVARQAQAQAQVADANRPVLADLGAHFGPEALGSLTGAVGAAAAQQQAGMTEQAARQQSLAAELAAQQQRSSQERISDADLAKTSSLVSAQGNLASILNQIGLQKAAAERQYAGDATDYERQKAATQVKAAEMAASSAGSTDPLDHEMKALKVDALRAKLDGGGDAKDILKQLQVQKVLDGLKRRSSVEQALAAPQPGKGRAKALFERILSESPDRKTAYSGLAAFLAGHEAFGNAKTPGKFQGARISPAVIRRWIDDWFADEK